MAGKRDCLQVICKFKPNPWETATTIQEETLPVILGGSSVIAQVSLPARPRLHPHPHIFLSPVAPGGPMYVS